MYLSLLFLLKYLLIVSTLEITSIKPCDDKIRAIFINVTIKNNVITYGFINSTIDVGNLPGFFELDYSIDNGKTFINICKLKTKNSCKTLNQLGGSLWHDIEREARVPEGVCPIRKGVYVIQNFRLNYNRLRFQGIPNGYLKAKLEATKNGVSVHCTKMEGKN